MNGTGDKSTSRIIGEYNDRDTGRGYVGHVVVSIYYSYNF